MHKQICSTVDVIVVFVLLKNDHKTLADRLHWTEFNDLKAIKWMQLTKSKLLGQLTISNTLTDQMYLIVN